LETSTTDAEAKFHGALTPAKLPTPPTPCRGEQPSADALLLFFGNSLTYSTASTFRALKIADENMLSVERTPEGIFLTATIYGEDGRIIGQVVSNELYVNNNPYRMKRHDSHSLTVYDPQGKVVLDVKYLNPSTLKVTGVFRSPRGSPVIVEEEQIILAANDSRRGVCFGANGAVY
jgi:hypothetical protein